MRVYEFSKEHGIPNKELLDMLKKGGFDIATHMAALTDDARIYLEKELKKKTTKEEVPVKAESIKPSPPKVTTVPKPMDQPIQPVSEKKVVPTPSVKPHVKAPVKQEVQQRVYTRPPVERIQPQAPSPLPTQILVTEMTVDEFSQKTRRPVGEVILALLRKGIAAPKNQMLSINVVADLARTFGLEVLMPEKKAQATVEKAVTLSQGNLQERMPVVVVMGHVDHGKTTLLDFIRKTRVAAKEKGGITQHLGAYEVNTAHGGIVFLDTPGHEAFSQIRMRGAKVADVAVLVVAADDSVKPQTIEALKHAQAMSIPVIVAVNKIDKVEPARVDVVKRDLANYNLLPEEWGGQTIFVPISAKLGTGVDQLLEILALQSQVMELKADPTGSGRGIVLESKLEKGRGPVATIICQEGKVKVGDFFICGMTQGKVNSMMNSFGERVNEVGPSIPVQISGFEELAGVGELFEVVDQEKYRKARSMKGDRRALMPKASSEQNTLNIIVKAEGNASKEALLGALAQLSDKSDKKIYIVHSGVGAISESDVILAANTGSSIVGLHVKIEPNAANIAQKNEVDIKIFDIIYQLLDELKLSLESAKEKVMVKQKVGEAVVRKVFDIKGLGVIAGCYVKDGRVTRDCTVVIWRGREKIGQGKIRSLQRDKRAVKEVHTGFECAFMVDGFDEWQEDDRIECFIEVPKD